MQPKVRVELTEPLIVDGQEVRVLELRTRQTVGDLVAASKAGEGVAQDVAMFARLAGLLPEDLEDMSLEDYERMALAVAAAKKPKKNPRQKRSPELSGSVPDTGRPASSNG